MKKNILFFTILFFNFSIAQVGINTTSPKASLDIQINDATNPTNEDGILIPRIDVFPTSNPTVDQNGMLVYLTTTVGTSEPGFYYWDNPTTTWIGLQKAGEKSRIIDADLDTKVDVEESADEDIIRFDMAGTEYFNMTSGRMNVLNTGGSIFIGNEAGLNDDRLNRRNTSIGDYAGRSNVSGVKNTYIGYRAGQNVLGEDNTMIGNEAGVNTTTGRRNVFLGSGSGVNNAGGERNVYLGYYSGSINSGSFNIFIGNEAGKNATGVSQKLYIDNSNTNNPLIWGDFANDLLTVHGELSVGDPTSGINYYSFPMASGTANQVLTTDGLGQTSWASPVAQNSLIDSDLDTKVEVEANADEDIIRFTTAGTEYFKMQKGRIDFVNTGRSVFIGEDAGLNDNFANNANNFIGYLSGSLNTSGVFNVGNGAKTLGSNTTGSQNTAIGHNAMMDNTTGSQNSAVGRYSMVNNLTGTENSALGVYSGRSNTTGVQNVSIGAYSGFSNLVGNGNVTIGYQTGFSALGNKNVFIGYQAGYNESGDNKLYIENSGSTSPLIYGEFDTNYVQVNGNFDVGANGDGTIARANAWNTFSDRRWKSNFKKIEKSLEKLDKINGYYYNWKNRDDKSLQVGVIAQEIEEVLPEIVSTDENGYKSVDYSKLSALLIEATKEQQTIIENQESQIQNLNEKYEDLQKEIENIKKMLNKK
jgi:hypothetical protein